MDNQLTPFEGSNIRKIEHNGEWFFSVVDVIQILTESKDPSNYWTMLKKRESELSTICKKFKFYAHDGKMRPTDCANIEGILTIIMSVPSPKAYDIKRWLAQAGKEKLHRLGNLISISELISTRTKSNLKAKFYEYKTYLMHDLTRDFYKIGKSKNPQIRENTLQAEHQQSNCCI
jgi:DNA-damage-inducible protein D